MKILIITDIEGVNNVLNFPDWCHPSGRYYQLGCRLLTEEVNAVVSGFLATDSEAEILVWDGHGEGAINVEILDSRVCLQSGSVGWPDFGSGFDVLAFVGQHAKAGTSGGHLAHTQTSDAIDFRINGVSLGEFGQLVYAMAERGTAPVFASGDLALAHEARELVPGIAVVAVKEGINPQLLPDVSTDTLFSFERAAIHYPRRKILMELKNAAHSALAHFRSIPEAFRFTLPAPPYCAEAEYRAIGTKLKKIFGDLPARKLRTQRHESVIASMQEFYTELEWRKPDGIRSIEVKS